MSLHSQRRRHLICDQLAFGPPTGFRLRGALKRRDAPVRIVAAGPRPLTLAEGFHDCPTGRLRSRCRCRTDLGLAAGAPWSIGALSPPPPPLSGPPVAMMLAIAADLSAVRAQSATSARGRLGGVARRTAELQPPIASRSEFMGGATSDQRRRRAKTGAPTSIDRRSASVAPDLWPSSTPRSAPYPPPSWWRIQRAANLSRRRPHQWIGRHRGPPPLCENAAPDRSASRRRRGDRRHR